MRMWWLAVPALLVILAGCLGAAEGIDTSPALTVANQTELDVSLFVNGDFIADFPAQSGERVDADLPPLPWNVEAQSPSGRILTSMRVEYGGVRTETDAEGVVTHTTAFGRVDLSCGRLTIWAGDTPPSGPPPGPEAGVPGDCTR